MQLYTALKKMLEEGTDAALVTAVENGTEKGGTGQKALFSGSKVVYSTFSDEITLQLQEKTLALISPGASLTMQVDSMEEGRLQVFAERFLPAPRLIILGAGHVGAAVARIAANLDYKIYLVDDRPSFAAPSLYPYAEKVICDQYESALEKIEPSPSDYIVIVTRGHRHDHLCVSKALRRPAAYIGMIGSKRKVKGQLVSLRAEGFDESDLARIYAPIGLPIGAVTEGEIALSILSEITRVRRELYPGEAIQEEVLNALTLLEKEGGKAVLATLVSALGSTPRKSGSRLLIQQDGAMIGTIGGGCGEAEVKREALTCLDQNRSKLIRLELTAEAAAEEGMACGGLLQVFLEPLAWSG